MANPNYVYAGAATWPGAAADTRTHGLYRLDPHTNDWEELAGGLPAAAEVRCILLDSRSPGIVWVGTQDGPFKSGDAGETWTALPLPAVGSPSCTTNWANCWNRPCAQARGHQMIVTPRLPTCCGARTCCASPQMRHPEANRWNSAALCDPTPRP